MTFGGCISTGSVKVYIVEKDLPQRVVEGNLYAGRNLTDPMTFITAVAEADGVTIGFDFPWDTLVSLHQALGTVIRAGNDGVREPEIPQVWVKALTYAVRRNKGILKVSSIKNHVAESPMTNEQVHSMLSCMVRDGYLTKPERVGQVYVWTVTERGRKVVE